MTASLPTAENPWERLERVDGEAFFATWMERLAFGLPGLAEAVLVWGEADGGLRPVAFWPPARPCSDVLAGLCEQALEMGLPISRATAQGTVLALPIQVGGELSGVLALRFAAQGLAPAATDWLRWGLGWLVARNAARGGVPESALQERLLSALDMLMIGLAEPKAAAACQAVATEAAVRLGCDRVSIGFGGSRGIRLAALSHSADFSRQLELSRALEAAMNEAADQGLALAIGGNARDQDRAERVIDREHAALVRSFGSGALLSVPFHAARDVHGVFLFEWADARPDPERQQLARTLVPILGHALAEKRHLDRPWHRHLLDAIADEARRLFGPRLAGRKLAALATVLVGLFLVFATGEFRVSAQAALEGGVRRVIAAPYDGFVASAQARAGHVVKSGEILATLDDRDLRLEASRWASQQTQYARQASDAEAQHNLAQIQIAVAQTRQAEAQRALSETMLARSRVVAPFAGVIVSGDLTQHLGGAVRKGQTLFEIAPLDSYRIALQVDEADIAHVAVGQTGELMVAALPGESFPFTVSLITPVAEARDGRNHFRIEATLGTATTRLRPGMEGIGKIAIGERRLAWIWTRRLTDWLRLQAWTWLGV